MVGGGAKIGHYRLARQPFSLAAAAQLLDAKTRD